MGEFIIRGVGMYTSHNLVSYHHPKITRLRQNINKGLSFPRAFKSPKINNQASLPWHFKPRLLKKISYCTTYYFNNNHSQIFHLSFEQKNYEVQAKFRLSTIRNHVKSYPTKHKTTSDILKRRKLSLYF